MKLREVTRQIIQLLETKSGYPVHVTEETRLSTIATIRIARDNVPAHVLALAPSPGTPPDYAICSQCAFAIRMFECPEGQRYQIAASHQGEEAVDRLLTAPKGIASKLGLSNAQLQPLRQQVLVGLITHLRSIPIGFRVVSWLDRNYPDLRLEERPVAEQELKMGREALEPRIKKMMPPEVFKPTSYMNTAHAIFWAERLGDPKLVNLYRAHGYERRGKELLEIASQTPDSPIHDRDLIDHWARELKLDGWYAWLPYVAP